MKKILLIAVAFLAFATSNAQSFIKGNTFLEGTTKFVTSDATKTFNLSPSVGYFVTDKYAVGVTANTQTTKEGVVKTSDSFSVGVFGRCYFLKIGKHFNTFSQLTLSSGSDKIADTKTLNANVGLGANYGITENLFLTLDVANIASYVSVKAGSASAVNVTSIGFAGLTNPLVTPTFGLTYRF